MSKKLKMGEGVSYMLGMYSHSPQKERASITAASSSEAAVEKFSYLALNELGIEPNKIIVGENEGMCNVTFYNSKLRKLFDAALEKKLRLFKYENAYAAQYVAGMYDAVGGINSKGVFLSGIDNADGMLLENLGIHEVQQGGKHYITSQAKFVEFIKRYSAKLPART